MNTHAHRRAVDRVADLVRHDTDLVGFWRGVTDVLTPAVPHAMAPCWFTFDPASLLVTSHFQEGLPEIPAEWLAAEYAADDPDSMAHVARSPGGVQSLAIATGGDVSRSARYDTGMREYGMCDELLAALRTPSGDAWGCVGLYREEGRGPFRPEEADLLRRLAPLIAHGARRALLAGQARDPEGPGAPGVVVVGPDWALESATPVAARWLEMRPDGDVDAGRLPSALLAVAGRARWDPGEGAPGDVAAARVRARDGTWVVLHGAILGDAADGRVAVVVEPGHPARISPLLMAAYGLTDREQTVTRLVLRGHSTAEIAAALVVSPHTVQEHLKSVFGKTGVRSRRELVGRVFVSHYEPRLRDNERRAAEGRPLRGGPAEPRA